MVFAPAFPHLRLAVKGADSQLGANIPELTYLVEVAEKPETCVTKLAKALAVVVAANAKNGTSLYDVKSIAFSAP